MNQHKDDNSTTTPQTQHESAPLTYHAGIVLFIREFFLSQGLRASACVRSRCGPFTEASRTAITFLSRESVSHRTGNRETALARTFLNREGVLVPRAAGLLFALNRNTAAFRNAITFLSRESVSHRTGNRETALARTFLSREGVPVLTAAGLLMRRCWRPSARPSRSDTF